MVVTGIGVISSLGIGKDKFWRNLLAGQSGVTKVSSFDTQNYPSHYGAEVKDFKPEDFLTIEQIKNMGRASQMAVAASKLALEDAGLNCESLADKNCGVIIGTTMGEAQELERIDKIWIEKGEDSIQAHQCLQYPANNISNNIARAFNFTGDNLVIPCACAAGNYAIGYAADIIKMGRSKLMLAGGVDPFSRYAFVGFNRLSSMAAEKCTPFDRNRQGIILGEGAGIVVIEELNDALQRGARIYAEISGYGLSCDAYNMTTPQFSGIIQAVLSALENTNVALNNVDYISAHGTGTPANDKIECLALKKVFGDQLQNIPISSIKSMLGHSMGAASAIEAITCALAIKHGCIPPTVNYETPDPDCNIDCVPNIYREHRVDVALNNGFAFGGNNACLVLKKVPFC